MVWPRPCASSKPAATVSASGDRSWSCGPAASSTLAYALRTSPRSSRPASSARASSRNASTGTLGPGSASPAKRTSRSTASSSAACWRSTARSIRNRSTTTSPTAATGRWRGCSPRTTPRPSSRRSPSRVCAAVAARASQPARSGGSRARRRAPSSTSSATPTRATPAPSWTARCSRATPMRCSRG